MRHYTQRFTPEDFAFQCLSVHKALLPHVSEHLGVDPMFTIGYLRIMGDPEYQFSERDLRAWAKYGVPHFASVKLHAWLTLPSFEILDYTLGATYYKVSGDKRAREAMLAMHYSSLDRMSYHPMILGDDIPPRIGAEIKILG
jgi:hypothetical protein